MTKKILHVGCGYERLPGELASLGDEIRLDINPACKPDIVGSFTDMGEVPAVDMVYSSHCLEHLYPHEVPVALRECFRVLRPGGVLVLRVPDLEDVRPTEDVLYESPAGPVRGLDMIYGMRSMLERNIHMAHHSGFIQATLGKAIMGAGFDQCRVHRDKETFELQAQAVKP